MTNTTNNTLHSKHLRILQYNVSRSREIIDSILNDREAENYTILLLQEPLTNVAHLSINPGRSLNPRSLITHHALPYMSITLRCQAVHSSNYPSHTAT